MTLSDRQLTTQKYNFHEIMDRNQSAIYRYLVRCTGNIDDAQELFQDTFLRAHRAYVGLSPDANHPAWLFRIATNLVKNYIRSRKRRRKVFVDGEALAPSNSASSNTSNAEDDLQSQETARILLKALQALPFRQRTALIQRQFEGLDYRLIAENLECSEGTARAHVYQALRKLRIRWHEVNTDKNC